MSSRSFAPVHLARWAAGYACCVALASAAAAEAPTSPSAAAAGGSCASLVPAPWPQSVIERRLHLRRMESVRPQCMAEPSFLAALGALWLEDGDAEQARVWLERALMLDPDSAGAQADHALALAALGEPTALRELATAWRQRSDVPGALRQRILAAIDPGYTLRLPSTRLGLPPQPARRATRGDASLLLGHESNLAISPRLTELTLTPPEGEVTLPVISTPRRGSAVRADVSWQAAWEVGPRQVLRSGLSASARSAPGESSTDWHQITGALGFQRQWGDWSGSAQIDAVWFGGALTEPYALVRGRLAADLAMENCSQALQLELNERRQTETRSADSSTTQLSWSLQCRPSAAPNWQWALSVRGGIDRPRYDTRPGGEQRVEAAGLRLNYRPTAVLALDLSTGYTRLSDQTGYSPLLENNAVRWQKQVFVMVEASRSLDLVWMPGAEWVLQATRFRQTSNLVLFRHDGYTVYSGLRWPW